MPSYDEGIPPAVLPRRKGRSSCPSTLACSFPGERKGGARPAYPCPPILVLVVSPHGGNRRPTSAVRGCRRAAAAGQLRHVPPLPPGALRAALRLARRGCPRASRPLRRHPRRRRRRTRRRAGRGGGEAPAAPVGDRRGGRERPGAGPRRGAAEAAVRVELGRPRWLGGIRPGRGRVADPAAHWARDAAEPLAGVASAALSHSSSFALSLFPLPRPSFKVWLTPAGRRFC